MKLSHGIISVSMLGVSMVSMASEWQFELSAGAIVSQSSWVEQDIVFSLIPSLKIDYGRWTFGGDVTEDTLLRYKLMHHDANLQVTPGIGYRDNGYSKLNRTKSSARVFDGYKAPEGELVASIEVSYQFVAMQVSQDISGYSKGTSLSAAAFCPLFEGENVQLYLSAGAEWKSAQYANALYGIKGQNIDELKGRFAYELDNTVNPFVSIDIFYSLTSHWVIHGGVSYEQLDRDIQKSPLVDRNGRSSVLLTLTYHL